MFVKVKTKRQKLKLKNMEINKIYLTDCLDLMSKMDDKFVDIIVTSPPYNVGENTKYVDGYKDDRTEEEYFSWMCRVIEEGLRVTKKHMFFNIQMLSHNRDVVMELWYKYKHRLKDIMIWVKHTAYPNGYGTMWSYYEFIFVFSNQAPHTRQFFDVNIKEGFSNVLQGKHAGAENKYSDIHKATFPIYIPRTLIHRFAQEGDLIFDPFSGTGTTAVAAIKEGCNYIGSEINPKYHEVSLKRIQNHDSVEELF